MKRFLYFFCILTLIAGFVSSCSKDDESDDNKGEGGNSVQKLLVKVKHVKEGCYEDSLKLEYDNKGRCTSITLYDANDLDENESKNYGDHFSSDLVYHFRYEDNKIIVEVEDDPNKTEIISLNDRGFIESIKGMVRNDYEYENKYEYDNLGQLVSETSYTQDWNGGALTVSKVAQYEWENGVIISRKRPGGFYSLVGETMHVYKYSEEFYPIPIENKANGLIFDHIYGRGFGYEYPIYTKFGVPSKYLPVSEHIYVYDDYENNLVLVNECEWDYTYTLDKDCYPIKIISEGEIYEYTWE